MSFRGTKRFELIRKVGEGGMGLVYEAHDNERDMRVALKTLREIDASNLYRFKREFRALTDISHPNIVGFYELVSEGNDWFFTMELVEGVDFLSYVRPAGWRAPDLNAPSTDPTAVLEFRAGEAAPRSESGERARAPELVPVARVPLDSLVQLGRLRPVLQQLAEALSALHGAGMVHRDLKPSNVRVTAKGRVVLMDFGIAAEASVLGEGSDGSISGTPAFMAPEQALGEAPTAAADWYSFGVMIYLALTGKLPFSGVPEMMLLAKQAGDSQSPSRLVEGIPQDLESLCIELLTRLPEDRPVGASVLERLGVSGDRFRTESPESSRAFFVGREQQLDELRAAFETLRSGVTTGAFVRGASGMGKSTLLRRFLAEVEADHIQPILLKGRCHERESLPYKAFDGVIDNLSHLLMRLPAERVQSLLPEEVDLLPRLFPVLRRVPGIQRARALGVTDPQELRSRAFAALSDLLRRLAEYRPLVIYIDDLQWADRDSLQLLVELLRDPDAPHLFFLAAMRAENLASDPALGEALRAVASRHPCREIEVGPLSNSEQKVLVSRLLGDTAPSERVPLDDAFLSESAGSPLFLSELVRYAREHGGVLPDSERPSLEDVLFLRVQRLPEAARLLLEAVATAGEPTPLWVLADAVGLSGEDRERALSILRVTSLVRVARHGREPWLAAYHDRVRETLAARLPADRLQILHRQLAEVLERWEDATVDALARHWLAAGNRTQAGAYLIKAARGAAEKLAFDRAAELYRAAVECGDYAPTEKRQLARDRGDALSLAGRGYEAAVVYQAAAEGAEPDEALELRRRAADNLLRSGHIEKGLVVLGDVMTRLGVRVASTRRRAVASLIWQRARIALRGLKYKPRGSSEVAAKDLARLDTLYAVSATLGMIDHIRGADVNSRHLLAALDLGEDRAACRALAIEAVFRSSFGGRQMKKAERISRDVELKARQIGDPMLIGVSQLAVGATNFFSGHYRASAVAFGEAERVFSSGCVGVEWERVTARYFFCISRIIMGDLAESARTTLRVIEEAERRQDLYSRNLFKTLPNTWRLLREDAGEEAQRELATALDGWPRDAFYIAHFTEVTARAIVLHYRGDSAGALAALRASLPDCKRAQLAQLPWVMIDYRRWTLCAAFAVGDFAEAESMLRHFEALKAPVTEGFVAMFRGALAYRSPQKRQAGLELLVRAIRHFEEAETAHLAAGCRYRLGLLLGGSEGARLQAEAMAWSQAQGIKNPERMIDLLVPRFLP